MEVLTAGSGFCLGIIRAYRGMNERALAEAPFKVAHQNSGGAFDTLTRIERRDPDLLAQYPGLGKLSVAHEPAALNEGDRLVLGFHGLPAETKASLAARGVDLLDDLICPFIAKLDRIVERLARDGFDIAIVGKRDNHHCREANKIAERHQRRCFVIEQPGDVDALPQAGRWALVGQVTGNTELFADVIERARTSTAPIKIAKTMCSDSYARQQAAADLARRADVVILLDDGGGAAQSVFEVCSRINPRIHRVRAKEEIRPEWFAAARSVAIVGGILVPRWSIDEAAQHVRSMFDSNSLSEAGSTNGLAGCGVNQGY
jgi:4-hydroxy-3-methylbut-2-enyl diphosphate reductase